MSAGWSVGAADGAAGCVARLGRASANRQERNRRIDELAVEVLVAIDERDPVERRAGQRLQTMIDREQLSLRQAVAWLDDAITIRSASRLLQQAQPDMKESGSGDRSGVDRTGLAALDRGQSDRLRPVPVQDLSTRQTATGCDGRTGRSHTALSDSHLLQPGTTASAILNSPRPSK